MVWDVANDGPFYGVEQRPIVAPATIVAANDNSPQLSLFGAAA